MSYCQLLAARPASAIGLIALWAFVVPLPSIAADPASTVQLALVLTCKTSIMHDPFKGPLAGPGVPAGVLPVTEKDKSDILSSSLPCQETVTPAEQNPNGGLEDAGLKNLQRGFDFYSWRTFIALNSPADGSPLETAKPETPTRWEDMANFKQLLDVMLPAGEAEAKWPTDRAGMQAERERLIPKECGALHSQMPDRFVVKMIEESFNEPFKTGPLIDQQGHYAIFDILMNRDMFEYISRHHLNTRAGQERADNSTLLVDFPPGENATGKLGAFMLKVSWKILSRDEVQAKRFHMVRALVLMPPAGEKSPRPCLSETLGLIGFHAVHKTASRPQWIWTTFEHKKNAPDSVEIADNKLEGPYNFFSVSCRGNCPGRNSTPPPPWDPDPTLSLKFRKDDSFKSQIVREIPLTNAAKNMNTIFHSMLPNNSVWQNYMLVSTQWPSAFGCTILHSKSGDAPDPKTDFLKQPDMTCSPAPAFLANSTLETYSQGEVPLASSSCIACHGNAVDFQMNPPNSQPNQRFQKQSDFTFMLEKAL